MSPHRLLRYGDGDAPPERPEIVARVDAPGLNLSAVVVTLSFGVTGADYGGEVRMRYDAVRRVFVHRLPSVTRTAVGEVAQGIWLSVQAAYPFVRVDWVQPPTSGWIPLASWCTVLSN
ncbi:hypothetical protein [Micromonospora fulviviridis]|uniref:hypothetical protein n=1 Tax=Micromonospora fulviviridis TaxID=47860 RepID=UPI0037885864